MKFIITRHGRTNENDQGILQGHLDGTLSPEGIIQVVRLASHLKKYKFDLILTSDLGRARDTAGIISHEHPHTQLIVTEGLREQHLGELQGKKKNEIDWTKVEKLGQFYSPRHGESPMELFKRGGKIIDTLQKNFQEGVFLLIGHDGINRALLAQLEKKSYEEFLVEPAQKNTAVNEVDIDRTGAIHVLKKNNIEHL